MRDMVWSWAFVPRMPTDSLLIIIGWYHQEYHCSLGGTGQGHRAARRGAQPGPRTVESLGDLR